MEEAQTYRAGCGDTTFASDFLPTLLGSSGGRSLAFTLPLLLLGFFEFDELQNLLVKGLEEETEEFFGVFLRSPPHRFKSGIVTQCIVNRGRRQGSRGGRRQE